MYVRTVPSEYSLPPKNNNKKIKIFLLVFGLLLAYGIFSWQHKPQGDEISEETLAEQEKAPEKSQRVVSYKIAEGDIPADVFSSQGSFDANDTAAILIASEDVYDFTRIKIGQTLRFYFEEESRAVRMEYDRDTERIVIVERKEDDFTVQEEEIDYEVSQTTARGTIENFFYVDAQSAGISAATTLEVGDIFAFDVDFTTEIQKGDEFVVIYEKRLRDGQPATDGNIIAAEFVNEGVAYQAYYFENDGQGGYYDSEGRVLERQFLKAPLSYSRISSGYTGTRLHPITRVVTAHYQIDYVAPSGTPVVSTAKGTITSAGWETGWGNIVRVKHDNGYTTHYGHLSAFAQGVRTGSVVSQNQLVGFVGSTGWSTGAHLDYGMKLNGSPVNPFNLNLPKGAPLEGEKMEEFMKLKNSISFDK